MKREQVFEFFRRLAEENPSPTTELEYDNPYTLLVAVVLSAQATDASVNIATRPLFEHVKTPEQMVVLGEEAFAVDTHIFRVCNRTGLAPGKHVLQVELKLEKVVPQPFRLNAHHWLILHGRYICKARLPECWRCPVIDLCRYKPKTPAPKGWKAAG